MHAIKYKIGKSAVVDYRYRKMQRRQYGDQESSIGIGRRGDIKFEMKIIICDSGQLNLLNM